MFTRVVYLPHSEGMRGSNVLTGVCPFTGGGGGEPQSWPGPHIPRSASHSLSCKVCDSPVLAGWGGGAGLDWGSPSKDWGAPRLGWGTWPDQDWGTPFPCGIGLGTPPPRQDWGTPPHPPGTGYAADGTPLAVSHRRTFLFIGKNTSICRFRTSLCPDFLVPTQTFPYFFSNFFQSSLTGKFNSIFLRFSFFGFSEDLVYCPSLNLIRLGSPSHEIQTVLKIRRDIKSHSITDVCR